MGAFSIGGWGLGSEGVSDNASSIDGSVFNFGPDACTILITAIKVKDLQSSSLSGKPNPYVAVTLGQARRKTAVRWGSKDAAWEKERITFTWGKSRLRSSRLLLTVFDKERIRRKTALGSTSVSLAPLDMRPIDSWFALDGGTSVGAAKGAIHLHVELVK